MDATQSRFTRVNAQLCRLTGRSEAELLSEACTPPLLIHPEDLPSLTTRTGTALRAGHGETQFRILRPDGSAIWVVSHVSVATRDEAGRPRLCLVLYRELD